MGELRFSSIRRGVYVTEWTVRGEPDVVKNSTCKSEKAKRRVRMIRCEYPGQRPVGLSV